MKNKTTSVKHRRAKLLACFATTLATVFMRDLVLLLVLAGSITATVRYALAK